MKLLYIFMGTILILIIVGEFLILCGILTLKKQSIKSQELIDRGSKLIWASVLMFIPVVIPIVFFWSAQTTKIKDHIGSMGDWIGFFICVKGLQNYIKLDNLRLLIYSLIAYISVLVDDNSVVVNGYLPNKSVKIRISGSF